MTAEVLVFPRVTQPHTSIKLADEETVVIFPFSRAECAIINAHLRERSPEILEDIADPAVEGVIERFIEHIWRAGVTAAKVSTPALTKIGAWLIPIAVLHMHSFYVLNHAPTMFIPGVA